MTGYEVKVHINDEPTVVATAAAVAEFAVRLWNDYKLGLYSSFTFSAASASCKVRAENAALAIQNVAEAVGLKAEVNEVAGGMHEFIQV